MSKSATTITLTGKKEIDVEWHIEGDEVVLDRCEGVDSASLSLVFPAWMMSAVKGKAE